MVKTGKTQPKSSTVAAAPGNTADATSTAASSRIAGNITDQVQAQQQAAAESIKSLPAKIKTRTPLWQLNITTTKLAEWEVVVQYARLEEYEYSWEGKPRTGKVFKCILVYVDDTTNNTAPPKYAREKRHHQPGPPAQSRSTEMAINFVCPESSST